MDKHKYRIYNWELDISIPAKDLPSAWKARDLIEETTDSDEWYVEHADGTTLKNEDYEPHKEFLAKYEKEQFG
jgi:hypothetical protein